MYVSYNQRAKLLHEYSAIAVKCFGFGANVEKSIIWQIIPAKSVDREFGGGGGLGGELCCWG